MIINITNEVFTKLKTELSGVTVLTSYPSTPPVFPCVIFEELTDNMEISTVDTAGEHHNNITYEINIFSDDPSKLAQIREIREQVDAIMNDLYGMNREFSGAVPNYMDMNLYRYVVRYNCLVDANKKVYRR